MNQGCHHFHSFAAASPRLLMAVLLFLLLLSSPLPANLPYESSQCSGTGEDCECGAAEDETPPDDSPAADDGRCCSCGGNGAEFGSVSLRIPFGRPLHEELNLQSQFSLYAVSASPLVYTTQHLQYRNRLLDRILQTEVAPAHCECILGDGWEERLESLSVFGRVVTDDTLGGNITHQVRLLGAKREPVVFQFTLNLDSHEHLTM